ncbi:MAG: hypothetical protein UIB39_08515, partial [Lachnospiraceae bacterium]|nr:hypothetical protein [Lachnospiraceae bacterium]
MEKRTMRFSLRTQFTLIIVALLAGMMLVSMLVNRTFLEDYYRTQKITALKKCRERLVEAAGRDEISSDDFDVELVKINNKDNIGIIVMNQDSMTIKSYGPDADTMQRRMWDNLLGLTPTKEELESYADGGEQGDHDNGDGDLLAPRHARFLAFVVQVITRVLGIRAVDDRLAGLGAASLLIRLVIRGRYEPAGFLRSAFWHVFAMVTLLF